MSILNEGKLAAGLVTGKSYSFKEICEIVRQEAVISSDLHRFRHTTRSLAAATDTEDIRVAFCVFDEPGFDGPVCDRSTNLFKVYALGGFKDKNGALTDPGKLFLLDQNGKPWTESSQQQEGFGNPFAMPLSDAHDVIVSYEKKFQNALGDMRLQHIETLQPVREDKLCSRFDPGMLRAVPVSFEQPAFLN